MSSFNQRGTRAELGARQGRFIVIVMILYALSAAAEIASAAPAITKYGEKNARAPKELDVFAFLVGHWEGSGRTRLKDGSFADFSASWIGRYILDGTAIADEFHSSAPDGSPYMGISLRQYDPRKKVLDHRVSQRLWFISPPASQCKFGISEIRRAGRHRDFGIRGYVESGNLSCGVP